MSAVWHRCTQRFAQDAQALLRAFGYDHEAALSSNATRIHSHLRASSVARTKHSSLSSNKANMLSQLQNDDASLADDESSSAKKDSKPPLLRLQMSTFLS